MRLLLGIRSAALTALIALAAVTPVQAQDAQPATIAGVVTEVGGRPLAAAHVVVTNQNTGNEYGTLSEADGAFAIRDLPPGTYKIAIRVVGYDLGGASDIALASGQAYQQDFALGTDAIALDAIEVFSTLAIERKTPVAYSNVDKEQLQQQLGSQDIPLVLNVTPSVYATEGGGGPGDARINVRGFNQRNIGVMINGVPVNDMENGWVYWSNWDGIGDATSLIQLQRGLSAVNLAVPSIGGTLNVITDATKMEQGAMIKQEFGSDGFVKTTGMFSTGLLDDKFAFMAQGVRKTGDGQRIGTWTDAWAYYVGASFLASETNRLDLFALGAPQSHGQNLYKQNIGAYSTEFALGLSDYDPAAAEEYPESVDGFKYNENYNTVNPAYTGLQAYGSNYHSRQDPGFINERENFFHKPQVNLNWYSVLSPSLNLTTVTYYSGGRGGGTGTLGSLVWDYSGPSRIADWDATIARNQMNVASRGILRASRNNQWTIGAISKLKKEFESPLTMEVGIDWRTAQIEHFRDVFDLLGGDYYLDDDNEFTGERRRVLGDTIDYNFTNTVDWLGGYLQAEYATDGYTVYGMGGLSTVKYTFTDHFNDDGFGNENYSETDNISGYQLKGGALLNVSDEVGVYGNVGYVSKVPIFDGVIDDFTGDVNTDPQNETFTSFEAGVNYNALDRSVAASVNVYFTQWNDRTTTRRVTDENGNTALFNLLGLDARHMGAEAQVSFRASDMLRIDIGGAVGDWKYTDDVSGTYQESAGAAATPFDFYVSDLKVGDQPQSSVSLAASVFPTEGLFLQVVGRANGKHYAEFNPFSRTDSDDRAQSWQIPGYTTADAHASYTLPDNLSIGKTAKIFLHVFNLTDNTYILEAVDNSRFNAFDDDHDADDAEVFFGLGRRINVGMQVGF